MVRLPSEPMATCLLLLGLKVDLSSLLFSLIAAVIHRCDCNRLAFIYCNIVDSGQKVGAN